MTRQRTLLPIVDTEINENGRLVYTIAHEGPKPYEETTMRTIEKIIPCVCTDHVPNSADRTDYGMPVLTPANLLKPGKQVWTVRCPKCQRGGLIEYRSPYQALKHWNELMIKCYFMKDRVDDLLEIMHKDVNELTDMMVASEMK